MLLSIVPPNNILSCKTIPMFSLRLLNFISFTLTPSIKISPLVASYNLGIKLTKELFPHPVDPIIPIVSPCLALKLISSNTFSLCSLYLK